MLLLLVVEFQRGEFLERDRPEEVLGRLRADRWLGVNRHHAVLGRARDRARVTSVIIVWRRVVGLQRDAVGVIDVRGRARRAENRHGLGRRRVDAREISLGAVKGIGEAAGAERRGAEEILLYVFLLLLGDADVGAALDRRRRLDDVRMMERRRLLVDDLAVGDHNILRIFAGQRGGLGDRRRSGLALRHVHEYLRRDGRARDRRHEVRVERRVPRAANQLDVPGLALAAVAALPRAAGPREGRQSEHVVLDLPNAIVERLGLVVVIGRTVTVVVQQRLRAVLMPHEGIAVRLLRLGFGVQLIV